MAKLRKRKVAKGYVYDIDFTFNGKRYIKSTKTDNPKIAKQILGDIQGKIARGTFNLLELEKKHILLHQLFDEYFTYAQNFKKATTINYERGYAHKFIKDVGNLDLRLISGQILDRWKSQKLQKVSGTTFNIHRCFLHAVFNVAVKWNYLEENPFTNLTKVRIEEKRNFFTDGELKLIFEEIDKDIADPTKKHLKQHNNLYRKYVEFLLNTGMRRQEALSLQKSQLDLDKNLMFVEKTKSKKYRTIPLNKKAVEILNELDDALFARLDVNNVSHKFNSILKRIGLTNFKLHSLRHTFATNLVGAGVDIYSVKELLGHADIRTSLVYAKVDTATLRNAVERLQK